MNNQSEFDRLLLGQTEPFATSLPWEKDRLSLDVTKLATPLAPILTDAAGTLAENFLASGSYTPSVLIGQSLLLGPQLSSFELLGTSGLGAASDSEAVGQTLDQLILSEAKAVAIAEWVSVGITEADRSLLETVQITVTDLPSQILGQANGYQISIDNDAAGVGWDVDLTPLANVNTGKQRVDLLTLVTHEFGHVLGLGHSAQGIMAATLPIGVRLAPTSIDLQQPRVDTSFSNENVVVPGLDLFVPEPPVVPIQVNIGQTLNLNWLVKNGGTVDTTRGFYSGVYLSDDPILDLAPITAGLTLSSAYDVLGSTTPTYDTYLEGSFLDSLAAGKQSTINTSLVIPRNATPGNKYLLFVADDYSSLTETNEQNNVTAVPINILAPDLAVNSLIVPSEVKANTQVNINWSIVNNGVIDSPAGSFYIQVVLSKDNIVGNNDDVDLGTYFTDLPIIAANGEIYTGSNSVYVPQSILGNYNLFLIIDSSYSQGDTDRSNNISTAIPVSILPAESPDLTVASYQLPVNPNWLNNVTVSWDVKNLGNLGINQSYADAVYWSRGQNFDRYSDTYLGASNHSTIGANGSSGDNYSNSNIVNLSAQNYIGNGYLIFVTDVNGAISERNENNNILTVPISVPGPDLTISPDVTSPSMVQTGQTVEVNWRVINSGSADLSNYVYNSIYLSNDQLFDVSDINVFNATLNNLSAGNESVINSSFVVPNNSANGSQYLLLVADSYRYRLELNENNNVRAIPIEIITPDLAVSNLVAPAVAGIGDAVSLNWSLVNRGTVDSPATYYYNRVVVSRDSIFGNGDDQEIGTYNSYTPAITANGGSNLSTIGITIPTNLLGDYSLFLISDALNSIGDADRTNNVSAPAAITITRPNLTFESFTAPAILTRGSLFDVSWTVKNDLDTRANGSWQDYLYLSNDNILDSSDRLISLPTTALTNGLNGQSTYNINRTLKLEGVVDGTYYLIAKTDAGNTQFETNENDNTSTLLVSVVSADLQANSVNAQDTAGNVITSVDLGKSFNVAWAVNTGALGRVNSTWNDAVYLSTDQVLSADDKIVLVRTQTKSLNTSDNYGSSGSPVVDTRYSVPL
jgi:subtilase family serine protease